MSVSTSMDEFLPIRTERLQLRRMRLADATQFASYRADPELARFQGWSPMSATQATEFVAAMQDHPLFVEGAWVQAAIAILPSDDLLGDLGFCLHAGGALEIGFTLRREAQGRGLATEALAGFLRSALQRSDVLRVIGHVDARNAASIRLLERLGMTMVSACEVDFKGERSRELRYELTQPGRAEPGRA